MSRVAVLAAMRSELRPFVRAAGLRREGDVLTGVVGSHDVVATIMGVGMDGAARTTERVLAAADVGRVIVIGIAGGIDTSLPIGHVLTPELVVDWEAGSEYRPTPWDGVTPAGSLVTFNNFDVEIERMAELLARGFAAVDMETAAVAAVCETRGCAWSAFRAISDNATDGSVDAGTAALVRPDGTPDLGGAVRYVLRRPWRIPRLARLGRDAGRAARAAAGAAIAALMA